MNNVKHELYQLCLTRIQERIKSAKIAMGEAQASSNEETKSSAGDKYETGRAMAHLEIEKCTTQLVEAEKLKRGLEAISERETLGKVQAGSLVITDQGNFYLSIPVGQIEIENQTYFAISVNSPIGSKLVGLNEGNEMSFRNKQYRIVQIL